jgi:hypothetical protein
MEQFSQPEHELSSELIHQILGPDYDSIWPVIHMKFLQSENGNYYNERLNIEIDKRNAFCASRGANKRGKRLSKNRLVQKTYENHMKSCDNHMGNRKEEIGKRKEERGNGRFIQPSLDEVRAYCTERKNTIDPEKWLAFYESNGWRVGKNPMKSWKSAIITWEKNDYGINQRSIGRTEATKTECTKYPDESWG